MSKKANSRWRQGTERYPASDPLIEVLRRLQNARSAPGWRNGARVVRR